VNRRLFTSLALLVSSAPGVALAQTAPARPAAPPAADATAPAAAPAATAATDSGWTTAAPPAAAPDQDDINARFEALNARLEAQEKKIAEQQKALDERDAAAASASDADVDETLRQLDQEGSDLSQYETPEPLQIYGFMDFGYYRIFADDDNSLLAALPAEKDSFVLGNMNLFFDAHPAKNVRALMELRFTNLPHGDEESLAPYVRNDSRVTDVTNVSGRRQVVAGSVIIERAWAQWAPLDELQLQVGQWLTPYGIWNIDHGTPTLISLILPVSQVDQYIPDRQVGVQALGTFQLGKGYELGYHAYVSNGRSAGLLDFTPRKAFGGRLFVGEPTSETPWRVGVSGYQGELTDMRKEVKSITPLIVEREYPIQGQEWSGAFDASLDVGNLRLRGESVVHHVAYDEGHRPDNGGGRYAPDAYSTDAYVLGAYRLPWFGLEPYLWMEVVHEPSSFGDTIFLPSAGVNIHFTPTVQLKTQYLYVLFTNQKTDSDDDVSRNNLSYVATRFVVSF
jgi:hypothetical protein